jgi:DNA processing protein
VACADCRARAALIAALAPAISRTALSRERLLALLALPDEQLLRAVEVERPRSRRLQRAPASERVPTALCAHEPDYPQTLAQLDCAPAVLHATCSAERLGELLAKPVIAIVGNRAPTEYAHEMAATLARELVIAGVTPIGGASGLQAIVHHVALDAGGHTIGVMGLAADRAYPSHDLHLHQSIVAQGAAISEFPPGFSETQQWCFTASQRMIAALAELVVVIEAPQRSSALFIARLASDLGRELAVVPGRVTDAGGPGMFGLLRDGAFPVSCAQDVLELIPMVHTTEHRAQRIAA